MSIYIYPTDTLWGIGCSAFDERGVDRIAEIKRTGKGKPLSILFADLEQLCGCFSFPEKMTLDWLEKFFDLETTLLIPKEYSKVEIPSYITCGSPFVGVRLVSNEATREICNELQGPVTTSSLNLTGEFPINDYEGAQKFAQEYATGAKVINASVVPSGKASSLIKIIDPPEFIRKGRFADEIQNHLGLLST